MVEIRSEREETFLGEASRDVLDVGHHSPPLLDDDDSRPFPAFR